MATRVTFLALLLVVLGCAATSARADSTSDFRVILNDPSCPQGAYCAQLGYTGTAPVTYTESNPLVFYAPEPIPVVPGGQTATCASDFFTGEGSGCTVWAVPSTTDANTFLGVAFWGTETVDVGSGFTIGVSGTSLSLLLPANFECDDQACPNGVITLTPEPSTIVLLAGGLLFLAFFRKRFRTPVVVA